MANKPGQNVFYATDHTTPVVIDIALVVNDDDLVFRIASRHSY
jgi:hypothetical protein